MNILPQVVGYQRVLLLKEPVRSLIYMDAFSKAHWMEKVINNDLLVRPVSFEECESNAEAMFGKINRSAWLLVLNHIEYNEDL